MVPFGKVFARKPEDWFSGSLLSSLAVSRFGQERKTPEKPWNILSGPSWATLPDHSSAHNYQLRFSRCPIATTGCSSEVAASGFSLADGTWTFKASNNNARVMSKEPANGHLEKRQGKGSRRKSCYRDRRVERAWNAHVPHRAAASTSSDTGQSLDHPPRRTTALWLRQRPGRSCSNYHPAI